MTQTEDNMTPELQPELCNAAPSLVRAPFGWEASGFLNDTGFCMPRIRRCDAEQMFRGVSDLFGYHRYGHEYGFQNNGGSGDPTGSDEPNKEYARERAQEKCILVLDDEPDIRAFVVATLGGLGYRVLEAASVNEATRVIEEEAGKVDLLLSDVVLPGTVSGPQFASRAKELYPDLKLVFMSGYTADLYTHDKVPGYEETLLTKPFRRADLTKAIEDALAD